MKRPHRPAKKKSRKVVRKKRQTKAQKAAQAEAQLRASLRQIDPYYLDPKLIPVRWVYQWKIEGASPPAGWTCVPFSRHAHDFPRDYQNLLGQIAFCGLVLMEATKDQFERESITPRREARAMHDNHPAAAIRHGLVAIMPDDWVESEKIPLDALQNEGDPIEVAVTLLMRVPVRWKSAALFLKLEFNEYVRRRILLERPILGCLDPFAPEAIYQSVNLQFTPIAPKES